ncbi:MAG: hypothetical protein AMK72_02655 [Planctomycetes bacterium SM23_25]|nr:MAG: hypothetical protein AMK72_02655 [Planctomycetes bacterium SM23_25]
MRQSKIAMRNSLAGFLNQAIAIPVGIFLFPFLADRIGDEAYGIYLLALSVIGVLEVLRSPMARTCMVTVAHDTELGNEDRINRTVSAAILFGLVVGVVAFVGLAVGSEWIYRLMDIPESLHAQAVTVLILAGGVILAGFPLFALQGVLWGHQRHDIGYGISAGMQIVRLVVLIAIFLAGYPSVIVLMVVTGVCHVGGAALQAAMARRMHPSLKIRLRTVTKADFAPLATFGTLLLVTQLLTILDVHAARWVSGKALGAEYVTYLYMATMVVHLVYQMAMQVTVVLAPIAARFKALDDTKQQLALVQRGGRYAVVMSAAALVGVLPMMHIFLKVWRGPEYIWLAPYAVVLGCVVVVTASSSASYQVLQGLGDARSPLVSMIVAVVAGFATMGVGLLVFDLGFAALIAALCVGQVLRWLLMTGMALRKLGGSWRSMAWQAYAHPLLAAVPAVAVAFGLQWWLQPAGWLRLIVVLVVSTGVYFIAMLPMLTRAEWQLLRDTQQSVRRVLKRWFHKGGLQGDNHADDPDRR